jgi:hypothetical protein
MWHWVELSPPSEADAVILILAMTFGKVLRTKPQKILIRLPIQNLEAVA